MADWPNLFLPGAPKAGTTALWGYLRAHSDIFLCDPKEPRFFEHQQPKAACRYLQLFAGKGATALYRGDASTCYLSNPAAIERIESLCNRPKYIVCLRNPIDLVHALHWEHVLQGIEPEHDFDTAWSLAKRRRHAAQQAPESTERRLIVYPDMGLLGLQVDRMLQEVDRSRVFFVVQEELRSKPRETYLQILEFLGLPDDERQEFRAVNQSSAPKSWHLHRAVNIAVRMRRKYGIKPIGAHINQLYWRFAYRHQVRSPLAPNLRKQAAKFFALDVRKLEMSVGFELSTYWQDFEDSAKNCFS